MTRKALAGRIAEVLFNEPATRRGAGAAQPKGYANFGRVLCCSSVKDHCGYSPSSRRAPRQNSQQRCYTDLTLGALGMPCGGERFISMPESQKVLLSKLKFRSCAALHICCLAITQLHTANFPPRYSSGQL